MFEEDRFKFLIVMIELQSDLMYVLFEIDREYSFDDFFLFVEGEIGIFKYFREHKIQMMI
jgi:hypothetical protein